MKLIIQCTAAEQTQIKRNIKINDTDTGIIYTQQFPKREDKSSGEQFLDQVKWEVTD